MDTLRIVTGEKRVPIERDGALTGYVVFDPTAIDFFQRFKELRYELEAKTDEHEARASELERVKELDNDGLPLNVDERLKFLQESCEYMRGRIDFVFGAGTSKIAFGDSLRFDVFEQFLQGISPYLEEAKAQAEAANAKRTERITGYTNRKPTRDNKPATKRAKK